MENTSMDKNCSFERYSCKTTRSKQLLTLIVIINVDKVIVSNSF